MKTASERPVTLAIDIGGTGIKSVTLDPKGNPVSEFRRVLTPVPATPAAVLKTLEESVREHGRFERIAAGFPGVIKAGTIYTAHNLHPKWVGMNLAAELKKRLKKPARVANDADVQALGASTGKGLEMMVTLGTGLGSALVFNGVLVPNLELGHQPFEDGYTYEELLGRDGMERIGKKRWGRRLLKAIAEWEHLFNYDVLHIGGGNAKKLTVDLPANVRITPNREGLLGGIWLWEERG